MNRLLSTVGVVAIGSVLASASAMAQDSQQVTVQAPHMVTKSAGFTASGSSIVDISLSYRVRVADLDLHTRSGVAELEKRVNAAAQAACREIGREYPDATPSNAACARTAAQKAMAPVRVLLAARSAAG